MNKVFKGKGELKIRIRYSLAAILRSSSAVDFVDGVRKVRIIAKYSHRFFVAKPPL